MKLDLDDIERRLRRGAQAGNFVAVADGIRMDAALALLKIARAAERFVDEQGKRVSIERGHTIGQAEDFAGEQFAQLVAAVTEAGR